MKKLKWYDLKKGMIIKFEPQEYKILDATRKGALLEIVTGKHKGKKSLVRMEKLLTFDIESVEYPQTELFAEQEDRLQNPEQY